MKKRERDSQIAFLERAFRSKFTSLEAADDKSAAGFASAALDAIVFDPDRSPGEPLYSSDYAERGRLAAKWLRIISEPLKYKRAGRTRAVLCGGMMEALRYVDDVEEAKNFASELSQVAQVFDTELQLLEAALKQEMEITNLSRVRLILEAANYGHREAGWTYPIVKMAAHRFVDSQEFLKMFGPKKVWA